MLLCNKLMLVFLYCFLQMTNAKGQLNEPYSFCGYHLSISDFGQLNFIFIDSGKCIRLSNGLSTLQVNATSPAFSITCPEKQSTNKVCPLVAYPNPADNFVNIKFAGCKEERTDEKIHFRLFNVLGQLISEKVIPSISLITGFHFDLTHLPNGTYYLSRNTEENHQVIKIIKFYEK